MNLKQIGAIVIIVLMVASVVGFTVFYNTPQQQPQEPEVPPLQQQPTVLKFKADNVDSEVAELLPSFRIGASTAEASIDALDRKVSSFSGVRSVRSLFRQAEEAEFGKGLIYVADIGFANDVNREAFLDYLQGLPEFSNLSTLNFALVSIPKKLELLPESGINLPKTHEFSDTIIEAFVSTGAEKGDRIKLNISITFSGNSVSEIIAFQNLEAVPELEQKQAILAATVSSLFPELLVEAIIDSAELADTNALKASFLSIADVNGALLSLPPDFNPFAAVSKPTEIAIKLSLSKTDSASAVSETKKFLETKNASFTIQQAGEISLSEITDSDTNSTFSVPEGKAVVLFKAGKKAGDKVKVQLFYLVADGNISQITGQETE